MIVSNCPACGNNTGECYAGPTFGKCKNKTNCIIKDIVRICNNSNTDIANVIINRLDIKNDIN